MIYLFVCSGQNKKNREIDMLAAARPSNETQRIEALHALNLLGSAREERFDRLTRLARRLFNVPIAIVTLVDSDNVFVKSCAGNDLVSVPRDVSFCAHAILSEDILVVPDTALDLRFHDSPLVTDDPYVRFYAGCPLTMPGGCRLGTLCLLDTMPRKLEAEDCKLLRDLAAMVEQEIGALQLATMDAMTMLSNRRGFEVLGQQAMNVCHRLGKPASLLFFDLNYFKKINDTFGHAEGDRALTVFADILRTIFRNSDLIGRLGGDEFSALLINSDASETMAAVQRLQDAVDVRNAQDRRGYDIRFSVGQVNLDLARHHTIGDMLAEGDMAMYRNKQLLKAQTAPH
jgi:diguanylate cyclase (GGDEF)-like protein